MSMMMIIMMLSYAVLLAARTLQPHSSYAVCGMQDWEGLDNAATTILDICCTEGTVAHSQAQSVPILQGFSLAGSIQGSKHSQQHFLPLDNSCAA